VPLRFARFDIHPADPARLAAELSGGNQQKLVMARALDRQLCVLVLAQPTRGVDVGTARTIHHAISQSAAQGVGVILISADLNELRTLCHRIVVMRRGRLVAELGPDATDETIGSRHARHRGNLMLAHQPNRGALHAALHWTTAPGRARIVFALAGALVLLNLMAFAFGEAPLDNLRRAFMGTWGTPYGIGQVLFKSTPSFSPGSRST